MTYIYQTVNENDFVQAFDDANRSENFTVPARRALFDYLTERAEGSGEPVELYVVALCCEWQEMSADMIRDEYDREPEDLHDATVVIPVRHYRSEEATYLVLAF